MHNKRIAICITMWYTMFTKEIFGGIENEKNRKSHYFGDCNIDDRNRCKRDSGAEDGDT